MNLLKTKICLALRIIVLETLYPSVKEETNSECHHLVNSSFELFRKQDTKIFQLIAKSFVNLPTEYLKVLHRSFKVSYREMTSKVE